MDKYEKVEGMTVGQVVQLMSEGVEVYRYQAGNKVVINTGVTGIFIGADCAEMDLISLRMELNDGRIYRKIEAPWWEKYVDCVVKVRDFNEDQWKFRVFTKHNGFSDFSFIDERGTGWKQMRPLTAAEKDAIITEG